MDPSLVSATPSPSCGRHDSIQAEIVSNFFVGYYDRGRYIDDPARIARAYLSSPSGLWSAAGAPPAPRPPTPRPPTDPPSHPPGSAVTARSGSRSAPSEPDSDIASS